MLKFIHLNVMRAAFVAVGLEQYCIYSSFEFLGDIERFKVQLLFSLQFTMCLNSFKFKSRCIKVK